MVEIKVKSLETGRVKSGKISLVDLFKKWNENIIEDITMCNCEPVGETNLVECGCYEEWAGDIEIKIRYENGEWQTIGSWEEL